jgi:antitoxin component YwqK of YwqJK toxin-antitoxin module
VIAALVAALLAAAPLSCPPGTERRGAAPPDDFAEWCEGKDDAGQPRREGPSRTWYDDGALWTEQAFREGEPDGPFVERHRNGRKAREGTYARGRKVGRWSVWFESGGREEESTFRDGVPDGPFTAFWPNGAVRTEGRRCGGAQCGRWRTYDDAGRELGAVDYGEQSSRP